MNPRAQAERTAGPSAELLTEGYEALRRQVLEREANRGWGLALFLTRGMAAWADAWVRCGSPTRRPSFGRSEKLAEPRAVVPDRKQDVIEVLAAMVWALQREVAA